MPSLENTNQSHTSVSFALSFVNRPPVHQTSSSNQPRSQTTFPESVFGWPALLFALQSAVHSLPFLRNLPLLQVPCTTDTLNPRLSYYPSVRMSQRLTTSTPVLPSIPMGSQPSVDDVTMIPVHSAPNQGPAGMNDDEPSTGSSTPRLCFTTLPDEIIAMCYANLPATDLVALEHVSLRLRDLIAYDAVCWRRCTEARWGHLSSNSAILSSAARHAGTWKQLYSEKACTDKQNSPWLTLCKSETAAILDIIKAEKPEATASSYWPMATEPATVPSSPPKESTVALASSSPVSVMTGGAPVDVLSVVLLVDASSSVTDDDFEAMKRFARALVNDLRVSHPEAFVGVVQFNQHPKVEVGLTNVCKSKLATAIDGMEQLMGSTDIAAPIRRARQILAEGDVRPGEKVIVLLTDGQTHADELQESEREAKKAFEEVGARLYTLGVGRDIDEVGLGRVAAGSKGGMHFTLRRLVPSK